MPSGAKKALVVTAILAVVAGGVVAWQLMGPGTAPAPGPDQPAPNSMSAKEIADAETKLVRVRTELKNRVEPAITKLRSERQSIREQLKGLGVADSNDLKKDFRAQGFGRELAEIVGLIRAMEQKRDALDKSSFEFESFIRRLKRKALVENAGLTEQELTEVSTTLKSLDAQLADIKEARPEISPAQLDSIIDEELGANSLQGRVERQVEIRQTRLTALNGRLSALKAVVAAAPGNASDVENLRARLERAIRQAVDEDHWPIKVAGCVLEEPAAQGAMARAAEYIVRQKGLAAQHGPTIEKIEKAIAGMSGEAAELQKLLEQVKADAGKTDESAVARAQEVRARLTSIADHAAPGDDPLLTGPAPNVEVFELLPK